MPSPEPFELYYPVEADWEQIRDIRIRSIVDTPLAFLESPDDARAQSESEWRRRGRRNAVPESLQVIARRGDRWIGTMGGFISLGTPTYGHAEPTIGQRRANLVGVWVEPEFRGPGGPAVALLGAVRNWAAEQGLDQLYLHVHEDNLRARRFYAGQGFRETGEHVPDPRDETELEIEMVSTGALSRDRTINLSSPRR